MADGIEAMLTGGHPNSLGRTEEVVTLVLADRTRLTELVGCYRSEDDVVRLRVSSAMKRVTTAQPLWTMDFMDRLQGEVAAVDQASTQWTLAILFDVTKALLSTQQTARALEIMKGNLANHQDWIVLNTTMQVLFDWRLEHPTLVAWLRGELERLGGDQRKSVSKRAKKLLAKL